MNTKTRKVFYQTAQQCGKLRGQLMDMDYRDLVVSPDTLSRHDIVEQTRERSRVAALLAFKNIHAMMIFTRFQRRWGSEKTTRRFEQ